MTGSWGSAASHSCGDGKNGTRGTRGQALPRLGVAVRIILEEIPVVRDARQAQGWVLDLWLLPPRYQFAAPA